MTYSLMSFFTMVQNDKTGVRNNKTNNKNHFLNKN